MRKEECFDGYEWRCHSKNCVNFKYCAKMGDSNFRAKDIGFRAQKKLLSRMANKSIAKVFIDDTTGSLLDNLYRLGRSQSGNKKEAEKVVKNIIKIVIKIGILYRNDQFNQEELWTAEQFKHKFHSTAMAIISFFEVEFSYDRNFLLQALNECRALLKNLVSRHLTDKSINRIEHVFNFFANPTFLDDVFSRDSNHKELLGKIVSDMHKLMEDGSL
ncbi:tumor necrosis factor alpha-induced protein 8-like protein [Trichonephila inaurata madagascariensis]|uniref:Tumor necrosis factor alpha-induced protein 8-like protein n=1 Tax=Trichonephila inaurata madagascariensis TaxID=2747483 RepID=A0A8X7BQN8_9ARAC|nr:tumor necrosis factor alpha-induced protein 8-like protein [Trichonephila inaurata madagascariensis]